MGEAAALVIVLLMGLAALSLMAPDLARPLVLIAWRLTFYVVFPLVVLMRIF